MDFTHSYVPERRTTSGSSKVFMKSPGRRLQQWGWRGALGKSYRISRGCHVKIIGTCEKIRYKWRFSWEISELNGGSVGKFSSELITRGYRALKRWLAIVAGSGRRPGEVCGSEALQAAWCGNDGCMMDMMGRRADFSIAAQLSSPLTSQVWCEKKIPINFTPLTPPLTPQSRWRVKSPNFNSSKGAFLPMDSDDISSSPVRSATCHLYPGFFQPPGIYLHMISIIYIDIYIYIFIIYIYIFIIYRMG